LNWKDEHYQEKADLLGVVRGYIACDPSLFGTTADVEILHYIDLAREYRDAFKEEKAASNGTRSDIECATLVRARLPLPQTEYIVFYPTRQCDYLRPERIFMLACVAVTGSRAGATTVAGIVLSRRTLKALHDRINAFLKWSDVPNQD